MELNVTSLIPDERDSEVAYYLITVPKGYWEHDVIHYLAENRLPQHTLLGTPKMIDSTLEYPEYGYDPATCGLPLKEKGFCVCARPFKQAK